MKVKTIMFIYEIMFNVQLNKVNGGVALCLCSTHLLTV